MIDGIELSKSDRAKCSNCGKKIGFGTPRGYELVGQSFGGFSKKFFCYECTEKNLEQNIKTLKEIKKKFKKMIKDNQKAIVLQEIKEIK